MGGGILHYDGVAWTAQASPTSVKLFSVFGSSGTNVFAGGGQGSRIIHSDGTAWTTQFQGLGLAGVRGLWSSSPTQAWAAGQNAGTGFGFILEYDGTTWTDALVPRPFLSFRNIWGNSPTDIFVGVERSQVGGGLVYHFDGTSWTEQVGAPTSVSNSPGS